MWGGTLRKDGRPRDSKGRVFYGAAGIEYCCGSLAAHHNQKSSTAEQVRTENERIHAVKRELEALFASAGADVAKHKTEMAIESIALNLASRYYYYYYFIFYFSSLSLPA
jgi:hypothetical protein